MYETEPGNVRGKLDLEKNMFNHHKAIINAKSALNITEPIPHVNASGQKPKCPPGILIFLI